MPPIPIYSKSPINANKASGVTPQTEADEKQPARQGSRATPTVDFTPTTTAAYAPPPPRPGATPSVPAPTGSATAASTDAPAPTQGLGGGGGGSAWSPRPPQPGAVPTVPGSSGSTAALQPPPKAGETHQPPPPPATTAAPQYPHQMANPALSTFDHQQMLQQNQRGTLTTPGPTPSTGTPLTQLPVPPSGNLAQPPGYHQNPNASMSSSSSSPWKEGQYQPYNGGVPSGADGSGDSPAEGLWNMAKKYAEAAGKELSEAESELWRRINKQ